MGTLLADPWQLLALLLALVVTVVAIPIFVRANGTRPFVTGYILISLSIVINAIQSITGNDPILSLPGRRIFTAAIVLGTLIWAMRSGHATHGGHDGH